VTSDVQLREKLVAVYPNISDADAYVGALAENHVTAGIVGPTMKASILEQFMRLRAADRFWYENTDFFTQDEVDEIHGIGLNELIRLVYPDEAKNANSLPVHPFYINERQLNSSLGGKFTPPSRFLSDNFSVVLWGGWLWFV